MQTKEITTNSKAPGLWDRIVRVDVPDPEEARIGRLFNGMMVVSLILALSLHAIFIIATRLGLFLDPQHGLTGARTSLYSIPLMIFCFIMTKRGHVRPMIPLFIMGNLIGISIDVFAYGGPVSPSWIIYFWPLALIGVFLPPRSVLYATAGVLAYYALLLGLQSFGRYNAPAPLPPEASRFLFIAFTLLMLLLTAGLVNYFNRRSLGEALERLQKTTRALLGTQQGLEDRVQLRTAELQIRAAQFQAIAEVNRAASSILNLDDLLNTTTRLVSERFGYDHTGIFLLDKDSEWAVLRAASSEGGRKMLERGHRLRMGQQGIVGYVAQAGVPRIALDVGEDAVWFNNPDLPDTHSEVALPLIARGQTIGVLDIQTHTPDAFRQEDLVALRVLSDGIAVAIDNTRLLEESKRNVQRLTQIQEQNAVQAWRQALARRRMELNLLYSGGEVAPVDAEHAAIPAAAENLGDLQVLTTEEGAYRLIAPVNVQRQKIGVLAFEKSRPWREDETRLAEFVVEQLGLALENARLLEETRLRAAQERVRSDIVDRLRGLGTTEAIMRSAARELGQALQVERSRIQLIPPEEEDQA